MQFFADGALEKAGAADGNDGDSKVDLVEQSIFMLELPTLSEDASLAAAIELGLRPHPCESAAAAKRFDATGYLKTIAGENHRVDKACIAQCARQTLNDTFPPLTWFPKLTFAQVKADVIAALTVGVMAVPQSMSYASIAGLDFVYGLYAAAVPALVYGFLGGSGQLAVGPVALVSLIVEEGLRDALTPRECPQYFDHQEDNINVAQPNQRLLVEDTLSTTCPAEYALLVHVCMFFVGLLQLGGSFAQLGFLVNFLGHPVVSGFTSGAAILIGMSQVKSWLGVKVQKSQYAYKTLQDLGGKIINGKAKPMPFMLGLTSYVSLWLMRKTSQKYPKRLGWLRPLGPLFVCITALILMICLPTLSDDWHVEVIGDVPRKPPPRTIRRVIRRLSQDYSRVLPTAASAALVGLLESIAIGKSLAAKHGYDLPSTREMRAIGCANFIGSLFSGYPVAGSFSRSAVANATGARTPLAGLVTSLFIFVTLLSIPPFASKLPRFVLASIVISSVVNLVAVDEAKWLWRVRKQDFCLWFLAFAGVLFIGVLYGLAIAVGVSLIIVLYESVRPQIIVLWKLPGTMVYRNVKQGETSGQFVDGVLVVRVGSSMYFFNVAYIKETVLHLARRFDKAMRKSGHVSSDEGDLGSVRYVVIEMTPVQSLDSTAIHMLEDLAKDLKRRGVHMCLASCGSRVEKTFRLAEVQTHVGYEWFHANVNAAVEFCVRHQAATNALRADSRLLASYRRTEHREHVTERSSDASVGEDVNVDIELSQMSASPLVRRSPRGSDSGSGNKNFEAGVGATNAPTPNGILQRFDGARPNVMGDMNDHKKDDRVAAKNDPRVLILASKHRVIDRNLSFSSIESELLMPEKRALAAISTDVVVNPINRQSQPESPPMTLSTARSLNEKRQFLATRRTMVQQSSTMSSLSEIAITVRETLAPGRAVAIPDEAVPDLMLFLAVDIADRSNRCRSSKMTRNALTNMAFLSRRPGVLRDISDILLSQLTLQVRFSEAAVVGRRSISIWRCEVMNRGEGNVIAAAYAAEIAVMRYFALDKAL